ncbi:MAG: pantetheine-phosphate adenylyltransferase [Leptospiraceae bacterium]|nr:pantetheine-phosphate adenylyltransferase [Leptospiraceae bacterium]
MKIAVYPGSFDPVTNGHLDIIERASRMFDRVIVAVAINSSKKGLFSRQERVELLEKVTARMANVHIDHFEGLLVEYCARQSAMAVIRGLRAVSDFDYEYAMYQMNREFDKGIDTVFLLASREYSYLSSTIIKEFARYGRSVAPYAPDAVNQALLSKFGHNALESN